jgi:hypothetical protein
VARTGSGLARANLRPQLWPEEFTAVWKLQANNQPAMTMEHLRSWTEIPEMSHFSGTATYSTEVSLGQSGQKKVVLDLGEVREIAEVAVNGKPAGVAWKRPYLIDVTGLLVDGRNVIEVKVTNLWINSMLGQQQPDFTELNERFGERFPNPSEWSNFQPFPSGLLGPVRLLVSAR